MQTKTMTPGAPANKSMTPGGPTPASKSSGRKPAVTDLPDSATADEIRAEILRLAAEADEILEAAQLAGRELTAAEAREVEALLNQCRRLRVRVVALQNDDGGNGAKNFKDLTDELSALGLGGDHLPGAGGSKTRGAAWGKAVIRQSSDQFGNFKGLTPSGSVLVAVPAPEAVALGRAVTRLTQVIPVTPCGGVFSYWQHQVRINRAAPVAEGARKPTSTNSGETITDRVRTLAHLSEGIPRQQLADAPQLEEFLTGEMFHGLAMTLEDQILNGDGVGENLQGLATTPGILTVPLVGPSDYERIVGLRRALTRLEGQGLAGSAYVMNPVDWEKVELSATGDGALVMQGADQRVPVDLASRRLFGLPVVTSPACPAGVAWAADFQGSVRIFERESAQLSWSQDTYRADAFGPGLGESDFARNLVAWRAEGRWGLAVTRPSGVVKVALA